MDEKLRLKMLEEVIMALHINHRPRDLRLDCAAIRFSRKSGRLLVDSIDVGDALYWLFNDIYIFDGFDLRDAVKAELYVI